MKKQDETIDETIDDLIRNVLSILPVPISERMASGADPDQTPYVELMFRKAQVLASLYQARSLNEIAQSLYELVRDGIGVKRHDEE